MGGLSGPTRLIAAMVSISIETIAFVPEFVSTVILSVVIVVTNPVTRSPFFS
jgi:hypothetical protein